MANINSINNIMTFLLLSRTFYTMLQSNVIVDIPTFIHTHMTHQIEKKMTSVIDLFLFMHFEKKTRVYPH